MLIIQYLAAPLTPLDGTPVGNQWPILSIIFFLLSEQRIKILMCCLKKKVIYIWLTKGVSFKFWFLTSNKNARTNTPKENTISYSLVNVTKIFWTDFASIFFDTKCLVNIVIIISYCYRFSCKYTTAASLIYGLAHDPYKLVTEFAPLHLNLCSIHSYTHKHGQTESWYLLTDFAWTKHLIFINITKKYEAKYCNQCAIVTPSLVCIEISAQMMVKQNNAMY